MERPLRPRRGQWYPPRACDDCTAPPLSRQLDDRVRGHETVGRPRWRRGSSIRSDLPSDGYPEAGGRPDRAPVARDPVPDGRRSGRGLLRPPLSRIRARRPQHVRAGTGRALLAPAVWAIYRRLWWPAVGLCRMAAPRHRRDVWWQTPQLADAGTATLAAAAIFVWLIPGVAAALTRQCARLSEGAAPGPVRRGPHRADRQGGALALPLRRDRAAARRGRGGGDARSRSGAAAPRLESAYADEVVRSRIAESLAAVAPLQRQLEGWFLSRLPSDAPPPDVVEARPGALAFAAVNVSPDNGRVRLALGSSIPELAGALDPARTGHRSPAARPVDLHSGRRPREIPAAGVQAGLTPRNLGRRGYASHVWPIAQPASSPGLLLPWLRPSKPGSLW